MLNWNIGASKGHSYQDVRTCEEDYLQLIHVKTWNRFFSSELLPMLRDVKSSSPPRMWLQYISGNWMTTMLWLTSFSKESHFLIVTVTDKPFLLQCRRSLFDSYRCIYRCSLPMQNAFQVLSFSNKSCFFLTNFFYPLFLTAGTIVSDFTFCLLSLYW